MLIEGLIPIIDSAFAEAGVPEGEWHHYRDHVVAAYSASYLVVPVPWGDKITPKQIEEATEGIVEGLQQIGDGFERLKCSFNIFDAARCTVRMADQRRSQALDDLIGSCLRTIINEISRVAFPTMEDREAQIEATLPKYDKGTLSDCRYEVAFRIAAAEVSSALARLPRAEFRTTPRSQHEYFVRFIGSVGEIYQWATGRPFSPHNKSETASASYRPPSCRFIENLWPGVGPIWGEAPKVAQIQLAWETYQLSRNTAEP